MGYFMINYGLPAVALRYFTVYGPRQRPDMAIHKFMRKMLAGEEIVLYGDGKQTRDFTYVTDIVTANLSATNQPCIGEIINIGGGCRISVLDLLNLIENSLQIPARLRFESVQRGDVDNTWADITKAKKILGYTSIISIEKGIELMTHWMQNDFNQI